MGVEAKNQWVELEGILRYDPDKSLRKRRERQLVLELKSRDLCRLYQWFIERRYWVRLQPSMLKPHVNVLRRQESSFEPPRDLWRKYEGERVKIEYLPDVEKHWQFYVLPVRSDRLNEIRVELGLKPRNELHITVARELEND